MDLKLVCNVDDIPEGKMARFDVEDTSLVIYHLKDGFYATQSQCTHLFASLEKGKVLDSCKIRCWFHHAEFDIKTGKVVKWANFPPGIQALNILRQKKDLKTYTTKVENQQVYVRID